MEKRLKCLEKTLNELDFVCRISPVYALISCRSYIENILNKVMDHASFDYEKMTLKEKISLFNKKGLLTGKIHTEITLIRQDGNDATHNFKGNENKAKFAFDTCKKLTNLISENINDFINRLEPKLKLENAKLYKGKIDRVGNKDFGFIIEENTREKVYFKPSKQGFEETTKIKKGYEVSFKVNITDRKTSYEASELKILGEVKNIDQDNDDPKYAFIDGKENDDIYLPFDNLSKKVMSRIKQGTQISFKTKEGRNKDEAYEVELIAS